MKSENLIRVSLLALLTSLLPIPGLAAGLDTLHLQPIERIIIVAPHPDDEVIACGGLIQQALALGDSVWVVYVTSGDGSWPSAWRVTGKMFPSSGDYLELGRARIQEAKSGAKLLGLDTTQLIFLGYPDADLTQLWQQNWNVPCRSTQTRVTADPYGENGRTYTGRNLLRDLDSLLGVLKPTRLFTPHPLDANPDHWSSAMFVAIAREDWRQPAAGPFPDVFCYLVHRPPCPEAQTDDSGFLSPPEGLTGLDHHWYAVSLDGRQRRTKQEALGCHDSQQGTFGSDLYGYVANNEIFDRIDEAAGMVTEDAPQVSFIPIGRLSSVEASVAGESLDLRVSLGGRPLSDFNYCLLAHFVEFGTDSAVHTGFAMDLTPSKLSDSQGWSERIPSDLPGHGVLLYSVAVKWGTVLLDHTGIGRVTY